ncbi:hypothetical protein N483_18015 [Pseudoalteromonas luteoviolacea NCIMB 1944]|nr:hypothetical protein N483_18015 [Pseudoalteromonas luteoviolacea NCIMB 1944]
MLRYLPCTFIIQAQIANNLGWNLTMPKDFRAELYDALAFLFLDIAAI